MLTGFVCEVDGTSGDAAAGGMEGGVRMRSLKHVPVWQYIQMACEERIVSVDEDVPGMRARYAWEEIVAVTDHEPWLVGR